MDGITIPDVYSRYSETVLGVPPEKNGDYAWLLDVLKSLKSNGKAAIIAVADGAEAFNAGAEVFVYDNFVGIEFDFYAVQQCLIAGDTRCYFVEGFDHLGNVDHDTVREYQGKVARNGIF